MAARDHRKGSIPFGFVPVPKDVLKDAQYIALPASAKALMLDLMGQFSGKNNGRLCPGFEVMKRSGWNSKHKLLRAKRALLACRFVMQTRIGHPPRTSEWLGFTWWRLDWHESMEVSPAGWDYLNFLALSVVPKRHAIPTKTAPGGAETAPRSQLSTGPSVPKRHHATEVKAVSPIGAETAPVLDLNHLCALPPGSPSIATSQDGPPSASRGKPAAPLGLLELALSRRSQQ